MTLPHGIKHGSGALNWHLDNRSLGRGTCGFLFLPLRFGPSVKAYALSLTAPSDKQGMAATAQEGTALNTVTSKCGEPSPIAGNIGDSRERPALISS